MKLVLDTNVVLDWLHFRDPGFDPIAQNIAESRMQLVTSVECLAELQRVLAYPEFRLDERQAAVLLKAYAEATELAVVSQQSVAGLPRCSDPDDQKFLELAQQAGAKYLVTRDKALLRLSRSTLRVAQFSVVTAAAMCGLLQSSTARRLGPESSAGAASSMDHTTLR